MKQAGSPRSRRGLGAGPDRGIHSIGAHPPRRGKAATAGLRALSALLLAVLVALSAGCSREPPEQALRDTIARMQAAAEARDAGALAEDIAEDFAGPEGMDRERFRQYLGLLWFRDKQSGVQLGPLEVELIGDRAKVGFTAVATGGEGWMPERAQVYQVSTGWRLEDGDWKLISARWEPKL